MTPRLRRLVNLMLAAIGTAVVTLGGVALVPIVQGRTELAIPAVAAASVAAVGAWLLYEVLAAHFSDLKLLHTSLQLLARGEVPPETLHTRWSGPRLDEVGQLARIVIDLASRRALEAGRPDQRLAAVIGALGDAVVVVTDSGQISLINAVGKGLLGHDRAAVGTSIYASLERDRLAETLDTARAARGRAIAASLLTVEGDELAARITDFGEHAGAVITITAREVEHYAEVDHALDLHDIPPPAAAPRPETPLSELPGLVLDTETTGLDVDLDRMCSIGAVRTHGARIYTGAAFDRLVNPGRSIPARSTAVHGITNAMVATVPGPAGVLPDLLPLMHHTVLIGHNTGYDLAMLRHGAREAGLAWQDPPSLDLLLLAAALDPDETDLNLESIALRLGVHVSGRHTALGDALVTAAVYVRLLPQMADRGVTSFGQALEFQQTAHRVIAKQKQAGW